MSRADLFIGEIKKSMASTINRHGLPLHYISTQPDCSGIPFDDITPERYVRWASSIERVKAHPHVQPFLATFEMTTDIGMCNQWVAEELWVFTQNEAVVYSAMIELGTLHAKQPTRVWANGYCVLAAFREKMSKRVLTVTRLRQTPPRKCAQCNALLPHDYIDLDRYADCIPAQYECRVGQLILSQEYRAYLYSRNPSASVLQLLRCALGEHDDVPSEHDWIMNRWERCSTSTEDYSDDSGYDSEESASEYSS